MAPKLTSLTKCDWCIPGSGSGTGSALGGCSKVLLAVRKFQQWHCECCSVVQVAVGIGVGVSPCSVVVPSSPLPTSVATRIKEARTLMMLAPTKIEESEAMASSWLSERMTSQAIQPTNPRLGKLHPKHEQRGTMNNPRIGILCCCCCYCWSL